MMAKIAGLLIAASPDNAVERAFPALSPTAPRLDIETLKRISGERNNSFPMTDRKPSRLSHSQIHRSQ